MTLVGKHNLSVALIFRVQTAIYRNAQHFIIVRQKGIRTNIHLGRMIHLQKCAQPAAMINMTMRNNHSIHCGNIHAALLALCKKVSSGPKSNKTLCRSVSMYKHSLFAFQILFALLYSLPTPRFSYLHLCFMLMPQLPQT